jgi:hypothetical protein
MFVVDARRSEKPGGDGEQVKVQGAKERAL